MIKMSKKEEIAIIFLEIQSKIGNVFIENEHEINDEVNDLLTYITLQLDEATELVAELEEVGEMKEEIVCPYCNEEQQYQGSLYRGERCGSTHSKVFFSEGNHKLECYGCGNVFLVNTEIRYVYGVEQITESKE